MTLDKIPVGSSGTILTVGGEGALRMRLLDMGLIPGTRVTVCKLAPLGDPIEIRLRSYELTIRRDDASLVAVNEETLSCLRSGCNGCAACRGCAGHSGGHTK